ncbi:signal peptidase I [Rhodococcus hoagii]|nr:signal peptidase I [Prescottella equi]
MRRVIRVALWVGAVVGTLCIVVAVAALAFGIKPLIFRSGSMEPEIGTGALAFSRTVAASDLNPGDIACVEDQTGQRITHRVVAVDAVAGDTTTLRLKGDANADEDVQRYHVETAAKVLFHVEKLGYAVVWLSSPPAVFAGGILVGLLVAVAVKPDWLDHRRRAGEQRGSSPALTAGAVLAAAALTLTGVVRVPTTAAAYADTATAVTGGFGTKAAFVPRIAAMSGTNTYVTCSDKSVSGPDPVTLSWSHLGAPYQYRIILRDLDGMIWRTWDVTPASSKTGDPVSFTIDGAGMPSRAAIWQYNAEIHTMLPGPPVSSGAVSTDWRGIGVSQHLQLGNEDMFCSNRGEQSGSPAYVPPPASVTCVSQPAGAQPARAALSWPHLGPPYTYTVSVRNENNRNIVLRRTVTSVPAQPGQLVSTTVSGSDLDSGTLSGTAAVAEIRTLSGSAESAGFVTQRLTVSRTATACAAPALTRSAPDAATTGTSAPETTPSSTSQTRSTPTSDAEPTTGTSHVEASSITTTVPVAPPSDPKSTPTPVESTAETNLPSTPSATEQVNATTTSDSGRQARLVHDGRWWVQVVDGSGVEVTRVSAEPDTRMHWLSGTDQLWLSAAAGPVYLDETTSWTPTQPQRPVPAEIEEAFT